MGVDRSIVIIILTFVGLLIMLALIIYYYGAAVRRADVLNVSKKMDEILSISSPIILYPKKNLKNKRTNSMSFFVFLILAIVVIVAMVMIYYLIYRGIISYKIEERAEELLNKNI
ncbi:MAG: hypothetical protein QW038_01905 [Nanopusillaceae archaeon]